MSYYHFTPVSGNAKTGPIPVTTSGSSTCPTVCPLKANGCYAEYGPLKLHWDAVSRGERGGTLSEVCDQIRHLPKFQLWRWGQAGDLPGDGTHISMPDMRALVKANLNRRGFAFTHYDPTDKANARAIKYANLKGFAVNLSANSLEHADKLYSLGIAPVVVLLPADQTKALKTPGGRHVSVCPASVRDDMTCARCGICAVNDRKAIIGFPAHGTGVKKAQTIFFRRV